MDIRNNINLLSKEFRVGFAIFLGLCIIVLTQYGSNVTKADVLFAEMVHTLADTLVITLLFIAFFVNQKLLKMLGKISGILLCLAGLLAFSKAYTTFVYVVSTQNYTIERGNVLLFVSLITILLIAIQMLLVWNEHAMLHGHIDDHKHIHTVLGAAKTELLADIIQACTGLGEYLVIVALPGAPLLVRFVDLVLTFGVGWWMIKRGTLILTGKDTHHHQAH